MPNLQQLLSEARSRFAIDEVVRFVAITEGQIPLLIDLMLDPKAEVNKKAAWAFSHLSDADPAYYKQYTERIVSALSKCNTSVERNLLRYLAIIDIAEEQQGFLTEHCYKRLLNPLTPSANRVHALQILCNMAILYPELQEELCITIESLMSTENSGSIQAHGKMVINQLKGKEKRKLTTMP